MADRDRVEKDIPPDQTYRPRRSLQFPITPGPSPIDLAWDRLKKRFPQTAERFKPIMDARRPTAETMLFEALSTLDDPTAAINRINASQYLAGVMDLDPDITYRNLEELSEYWHGKVTPPQPFTQTVRDAWDNGMKNSRIGDLAIQWRNAGGLDVELQQRIEAVEATIVPLTDTPLPWIKRAILIAAESSPLMLRAIMTSGIAGASTGIASGLALGTIAAPATAGISVPALTMAMASVGFLGGSYVGFQKTLEGLSYYDLRKKGVPHEIADTVSAITGSIEGVIEMTGQALMGLVPGVSSIGARVANKMLLTGALSAIATRFVAQVGGVGISEGLEEWLQETTDIFSEQLSMELAKIQGIETKIDPLTLAEFVDRTTKAFSGGFSAGIIFGVAGAPAGIYADVKQLGAVRDLADRTADKRTFVNTAQDMILRDSRVSDSAWRDYLGKVWDKRHPEARAAAPLPAAVTQALPITPEVGEPPVTAPVEYREPKGELYTETVTERTTAEGVSAILKAGNPETGERYGYIAYETVGEDIYIEDVVNETDQDLRRDLIMDLAAKYPGRDIEWNPVEPEEVALKETIIADNPRGPEAGLQHFERPEIAPIAEAPTEAPLIRTIFTQRMAEIFNLSTQEAEYFGTFSDILARNEGIPTNEWLAKYIGPEVGRTTAETEAALTARAGVAGTAFRVGERYVSPLAVDVEGLKGQVRAVFSALEKADFHQGAHEFFHAVERLALSPEQTGLFETALGKLRNTWTEADLEKLANYFEDYLETGKAPTPELTTVFEKIAELLRQLVSFIRERLERGPFKLSPEFLAAYDALFAKPESGLAKGAPPLGRGYPMTVVGGTEFAPPAKYVEFFNSDAYQAYTDKAGNACTVEPDPFGESGHAAERGWEEERYATYRRKEAGGFSHVVAKALPYQADPYEAQWDLDAYAKKNGWQPVPEEPPPSPVEEEPVEEAVQDDIMAPELTPPDPAPTTTRFDMSTVPVVEARVADITLSKEVPNFKQAATEKGIIERLEGKEYERLGTAPIVLWKRLSGELEVITGRHRLDLAQRLGEETLPAQVVGEAEGFTAEQAMTFDAESNIRDGQGSVSDYANYFRFTEVTDEEASSRGLLARDKGRKGFAIGKYASDGLYSLYRNEKINETKAAAIASTVPLDEKLQDAGILQAKELTADELTNYLNILKGAVTTAEVFQTDLFGKDESFMLEAAALAKEAVKKMDELRTEYNALKGALRLSVGERSKIVAKYGFTTGDVVAVQERLDALAMEIEAWTNWTIDSEKHAELRARMKEGMLFHPDYIVAGGEPIAKKPNVEGERIREIIAAEENRLAKLRSGDFEGERVLMMDEKQKAKLITNVERYISNLEKVTDKGAKLRYPDTTHIWYYIHRSTRPEETGRWRITTWDKRGPVGHHLAWRYAPKPKLPPEVAGAENVDELVALVYTESFAGDEIVETVGTPYIMLFHPDTDPWILKSAMIADHKMKGPMPASQIGAMMLNSGVKAEEMKWIGLDDFLKGNKKLSPYDVVRFIAENNVRIKEVLRRKVEATRTLEKIASDLYGLPYVELSETQHSEVIAVSTEEQYPTPTKYEQYTLAGGKDYRELELILPVGGAEDISELDRQYLELSRLAEQKYGVRNLFDAEDQNLLSTEESEKLKRIEEGFRRVNRGPAYQSPHWPERNVLAHVRFNERTDADGKRILFIEELQSDWHQAGREFGYKADLSEIAKETLVAERPRGIWEVSTEGGVFISNIGYAIEMNTAEKAIAEARRRLLEEPERTGPGSPGIIPRAPFAKTWHELTFKRMLRWAVENGFEQLAWTTGEQQADRYDLAKYVDSLKVSKFAKATATFPSGATTTIGVEAAEHAGAWVGLPGTWHLTAYKGKGVVFQQEMDSPEELPRYIGKDLANQALESLGPKRAGTVVYSGLDLRMGGEGMKAFYDRILLNYANKYGKKWGAKVAQTRITAAKVADRLRYVVQVGGDAYDAFETMEAAEDVADTLRPHTESAVTVFDSHMKTVFSVHSLPITPQMKEGLAIGQFLFHYDPKWQEELIYGTPISEDIWQKYVDDAREFESPEEFRADMVERYGQLLEGDIAGTEATEFYNQVWEEAQEEVEEEPAPPVKIKTPEIEGREEYDYADKMTAAQDVVDDEMARKMQRGIVTEEELDELSREKRAEIVSLEESMTEAREGATDVLDEMDPEERKLIALGDRLEEALTQAEGLATAEVSEEKAARIKVLEEKIKGLYVQFKEALLANLKPAETLLKEMVWQKAIIMGEQIGEEVVQRTGESYERAVKLGRELQKAIDEKKAKKVALTVKEKHAASRARIYAKKRLQMAAFKKKLRDAKANRRAVKKYKDAKKKLIADIMKPPAKSVAFKGYAEAIRELQRYLDPKNRIGRTLYNREQSRRFFAENPEAAALVPPKDLDKIFSVVLPRLDLAQLEEIDQMINTLRKLGRLKRSLVLVQEFRLRRETRADAAVTVLRGEEPVKAVGGAKPTRRSFALFLETLKPGRVAQLLDGMFGGRAVKEGIFTKLLQEDVNEAWSAKQKSMRERSTPVIELMKELKLTLDPLDLRILTKGFSSLSKKMDINGFRRTNGKMPIVREAMMWYLGMQNPETKAALLYGNNLPPEVILKGIAMLTPNQRALADAISRDWVINFPRLRDAFIDAFNMDLPGVSFYVPMRRMEISYETRDEEIAADLTAQAGVRKQFVARHPTFERIKDIADEHQKPIQEDLISLWMESVAIQEGFIHQDQLIKRLHSILEGDQVRAAVAQKYGPAMNKWIKEYINTLAQIDPFRVTKGWEKFSRRMRGHAVIAWLAGNLTPLLKQLTGPLNYMADAGPIYMSSAAAQWIAGKGKSIAKGKPLNNTLVDLVDSKTELLKGRQISREMEEFKRMSGNAYEQAIKKGGALQMAVWTIVDLATCYIGWKAVYDKTMAKNGGVEALAIKAADKSTIRTQPSARVQDIAAIYRAGEAMKWFTMFSSELSAIWNRLAFDLPLAVRRGEMINVAAEMAAFSLVGLGIAIAMGALEGDDWDEKKKKVYTGLYSQYIESIPIFGNDIFAAISGKQWQSSGVKMVPALDYIMYLPGQLKRGDYEKAITSMIKATAFTIGLPVSGPAKAYKAAKAKDWRALLGWPVSEKK